MFATQYHIIPVQHGKRLVADKSFCTQYCMTQTFRLLLPHILDVCHLGDCHHLVVDLLLFAGKQPGFQLRVAVEVVLHGGLSSAGDNQNVLDAAVYRFLHDVLDGRFIDDGQHLFWHGFGCRQHTGP